MMRSGLAVSAPIRRLHAFLKNRQGVAAIEVALIAPVILLIMVAMVDYGLVLYARLSLNENLSASANYAIAKASQVSAASGATLASNLVAAIPSNVDVTAIVNNGPSATRTSGSTSTGGTAANADSCYCPSVTGMTVSWGAATTCGNACGNGRAGKFVSITASVSHSPLFSNYGFVQNGTITTFAVVQVQ